MGWLPSRIIAMLGLSALLIGLSAGCSAKDSIRYKTTVEVETPDGLRTGSSVLELEVWEKAFSLTGHTRGRQLHGEAVAVDLPGDRLLVALIVEENPEATEYPDIVLGALDPSYKNDWAESVERIASGRTPKGSRRVTSYPLLVTFENSQNPATVEPVDPRNLSATFGPGYRLKAITVKHTDEPQTKEIGRKLPWLRQYWVGPPTLVPNPPDFPDGSIEDRIKSLSAGAFTTEQP